MFSYGDLNANYNAQHNCSQFYLSSSCFRMVKITIKKSDLVKESGSDVSAENSGSEEEVRSL